MVIEPSTPTKNQSLRSADKRLDTLRSIIPTTPKKWELKVNTAIPPIFCCEGCNGFMIDKEPFAEFMQAASKGISTLESGAQIVIHSVEHLIELVPSLEISNLKLSTRYFVCLMPTNEYREVNQDCFDYFQANKQATTVLRSWFTCAEHQHGYQLSKFESTEVVKEGLGIKNAELSPQQFSREKRKIMVRKISYGRDDMIKGLARRLSNAEKEDIDAVSRRLSFARKEEVAEVARRLSCGKESMGEDVDLHLARVSMYFSESRLC